MSQRRYEITAFEWLVNAPLLPNAPGGVSRVDDRRALNGIFRRLRSGSLEPISLERYGISMQPTSDRDSAPAAAGDLALA